MDTTYTCYIPPCWVQCHFGVIQCTFLKMACNSKPAGRRVKSIESCDSGILVMHMGYIGRSCVKGHFGVIHCTSLKMVCISNMAGHS